MFIARVSLVCALVACMCVATASADAALEQSRSAGKAEGVKVAAELCKSVLARWLAGEKGKKAAYIGLPSTYNGKTFFYACADVQVELQCFRPDTPNECLYVDFEPIYEYESIKRCVGAANKFAPDPAGDKWTYIQGGNP